MLRNFFSFYKKSTSNLQLLYKMSKQTKTPYFTLQSHNIRIIEDPLDFYMAIYKGIKNSTFRIGWSSLYLGTGSLERFLLNAIVKKSKQIPDLQTIMLFDYNRSLRQQNGQSSVEMINNAFSVLDKNQYKVAFNRQSKTKGVLGQISGVHHQKIYIFDNNVILGGANLSHNYFLNRKDRYLKFKNAQGFSDYLFDYLRLMSENSYQLSEKPVRPPSQNLQQHYKLWKFSNSPEQYKDSFFQQQKYLNNIIQQRLQEQERGSVNPEKKIPKTRNMIISEQLGSDIKVYDEVSEEERTIRKQNVRENLFSIGHEDFIGNALMQIENLHEQGTQITQVGQNVYIFPFIQDPKLKQKSQKEVFHSILKNSIEQGHSLKISSGYLNFSSETIDILSKAKVKNQILCSAPEANSFFRAGKFKKYIPYFYRCYEGQVLEKHPTTFSIKEFNNGKWSFHAKGVWIKQNQNNYLTIVGSSNFNKRSQGRDSELQAYLYSTCPSFNNRLESQWKETQKHCSAVTLEDIRSDQQVKYNWFSRAFSFLFSKYL